MSVPIYSISMRSVIIINVMFDRILNFIRQNEERERVRQPVLLLLPKLLLVLRQRRCSLRDLLLSPKQLYRPSAF